MRNLPGGLALLLIGVVLTGCIAHTNRSTGNKPLELGKTVVDIRGVDADGTPFQLSDYRGKVVLLDFWASW